MLAKRVTLNNGQVMHKWHARTLTHAHIIYTRTHINIDTHLHTHTPTHENIYMHIYTYTHTCIYTRAYRRARVHVYILYTRTYVYTHINTPTHAPDTDVYICTYSIVMYQNVTPWMTVYHTFPRSAHDDKGRYGNRLQRKLGSLEEPKIYLNRY